MRKINIGKGLEVSVVGLGCMGLSHAFGPETEKEVGIKLLQEAVAIGYNFFDTAEIYGAHNEELVGEALEPYQDRVVIATKFGIKGMCNKTGKMDLDSSEAGIRESLEGSLKRLRVETIDLYYQHRQDPNTPVENVARTMQKLIDEGKIKAWGLSACDADTIRRAHAICPVTAVENEYSMAYRTMEKDGVLEVCEELDIAVVPYSPLAKGFLTNTIEKGATFAEGDLRGIMKRFSDEAMEANQELLQFVVGLAEEKGATPAQISLVWVMARNEKCIPIPGTRNVERLRENAGAAEIMLSKDEYTRINELLAKIDFMEVNFF
ncbi:MAG: aldo/keto reductase [Turicibacter sp.]|nr:aldo/keto reductase [Turicibacter sp.]